MRVALVQIQLDPKSRAANLQVLDAAIDEAANANPAPDLIALPGACDTGGVSPARGGDQTALEVVKGNMALKAREWGVFMAVGLHVQCDDKWIPCAVLFDPDGDVVVRSVASAAGKDAESSVHIELWASAVGDLGVFEPTIAELPGGRAVVSDRGALITIPTVASLGGKRQSTTAANIASLRSDPAAGCGAYWAVVGAAMKQKSSRDGSGWRTFIRAPSGAIIASVECSDETIVHAEVPIKPATCASRTDMMKRDGHAD